MALSHELELAKTFDKSDLAYCVIKIILDDDGKPIDWEFVYLNDALAKLEGVAKENLLHHRFFEVFPDADRKWFEYYYPAAFEEKSCVIDEISREIGSVLRIHCFPVEYGYCGCMLEDVTNEFENVTLEGRRQRDEAQAALKVALEETKRANRAKTVFLNSMSHDIRTPMNAILGFAELANLHIDQKEMVADYLQKIQIAGSHLISLLNDVLDMSRIESGKLTVYNNPENIREIGQIIEAVFTTYLQEKNIDFTVQYHNLADENVICDRNRLTRILINILSNASKYTPEGGRISLSVSECEKEQNKAIYEFRIKDNGVGMSEEFLKTLYEPFTRERTSTESGIEGVGIGMTITRSFVDLLGGTIDCHSKKEQGTEFIVRIPFELQKGAEKQSLLSQDAKVEIKKAGNKHILLAEDNEMNRQYAEEILKMAGYEVTSVEDGYEACNYLFEAQEGAVDLVLLDVQMPNMNGYEATRRIRESKEKWIANIPIIAMTANAFEEDKDEAMAVGMNGYIAKPIVRKKLYALIEKYGMKAGETANES